MYIYVCMYVTMFVATIRSRMRYNSCEDDLEQLILKLLAEAGGDVLKDDTLIVTLDQSKKTGSECQDR